MYHIKADIRMYRSADKVLSALTVCLKSKPFSAVTFTDLQKASGVGRSTIYRLFDTTADILAYGCGRCSNIDCRRSRVKTRIKDVEEGWCIKGVDEVSTKTAWLCLGNICYDCCSA